MGKTLNFSNEALFELVMILSTARPGLIKIFKPVMLNPDSKMTVKDWLSKDDNIETITAALFDTILSCKERYYNFVAHLLQKTVEEVRLLSALETMEVIEQLIQSEDFSKIAGKLQTIIQKAMIQAQTQTEMEKALENLKNSENLQPGNLEAQNTENTLTESSETTTEF